jgi:hypothetical protein
MLVIERIGVIKYLTCVAAGRDLSAFVSSIVSCNLDPTATDGMGGR